MIAWRGAGILMFFFGAAGFFFVVLGFDGPAKGTLYPWSLAALGIGAVSLPIGWLLNRRRPRDNTHDFMFIPMEWWGGLLLVVGGGMLGAHFFLNAESEPEAQAPCVELSGVLASCTDPAAAMLGVLCTQQPPDVQAACLSCMQAEADPCSPTNCQSACIGR
ncbi:MAG: hypothetical protein AAF411_09115 [Myxococcota bacterium]